MKKIKLSNWNSKSVEKLVGKMLQMRQNFLDKLYKGDTVRLYIANGNSKTGIIPSVSTIPVADCKNCSACKNHCYDLLHDCTHTQCATTRARNSAILQFDCEEFFKQVGYYVLLYRPRWFRYNIGGDIKDYIYFQYMVKTAIENPDTIFMAFTKAYDIVNSYIDEFGSLPENLKILFSIWPKLDCDNRHNLPTAHLLLEDGSTTAKPFAFYCPNNCTNCCIDKKGCFFLKEGEEVILKAH